MGVILGVADIAIVETKQKNLLSWLPGTQTDLVGRTSRVSCRAWEQILKTQYNYYSQAQTLTWFKWFTMFLIKNNNPTKRNVFREAWFTQLPIKKKSLGNRNTVSPIRVRGLDYHSGSELGCHYNKLIRTCSLPVWQLSSGLGLNSLEILWKHSATSFIKLTCQNCLLQLLSYITIPIIIHVNTFSFLRHYLTLPQGI